VAADVRVNITGDSRSLEKAFSNVGQSAKTMAADLDSASAKSRNFGGAMDRAGEAAGNSESKFMGTADILDGLGGAFGLPTDKATGLFRAFGDLSGGFEAIQPLFTGVLTKLGLMTSATAAETTATTAATGAQTGLNAALAANPIGLVVAAIAALVAIGFVVVKNWDTIKAAFSATWGWIKDRLNDLVGIIGGLPGRIATVARGMFDGIKEAFRAALNWVIDRWNGLEFKLPDVGFGPFRTPGFTLGVPDIPKFHSGGVVPGPRGAAVPILAQAGETVTPAGAGTVTIRIPVILDGRVLTEVVHNGLLAKQRRTPLGLAT